MRRLRIAVVTPELPNREYPNRGRSVLQTLLHLRNHADITAFCPLPHYPARFRPRFDYRPSDPSYALPGVPANYFEFPAFPVISRPVNGVVCAHYLEPHLRECQPDVILNFWLYPAGFAALRVGRKLRIPVIVGSIGSDLNNIPDPVSHWLIRKTLSGASRVLTKSAQLRSRVLEMGADPGKTYVVANGCDGDLFFLRDRASARRTLKVPESAELILFVGRLNRAKGIGGLLEAVTILAKRRPHLHLVYVGDGPELETMQEKVQAPHAGARVSFAGACSPAEVAQWLAACNLLALPSNAEGCPNVVIEALSSGRPVVATKVGALPDLIDRCSGILVDVGNSGALIHALDQALDSGWDEQAIARRFRRSWQQVAQEVFAICQDSFNASGRPRLN